ncbi:RICIN domain-containing protein [Catellatospora paridis]|uniref:RICIN domain-containing protein n=1 Tax=Catellatospora paridis TaxID=1617086 RepID=UPI001E36B0E2|nr:RICIN domain-containing protein [Catellatospora paridis]
MSGIGTIPQVLPRRRGWRTALIAVLATALAGTGLVVVGTGSAQAATVDTGAWYILVNRNSGKALDVYNFSTADGGRITQWTRGTANNQQWQFVDSGSGYYRLKSRHSGKVLDVYNFSTANGASIVQWADGNGTNQQWRLADSADGYVRFINRNSSKALEVQGASTADGANIVQYDDWGGNNQQWQLVRVGTNPTPSASSSPPPSSGNYTNPVLWQDFADIDIIRVGDAYYYSASTMHYSPGAPILRSYDLVNWEFAGHSVPVLDHSSAYNLSGGRAYVKGIWASTLNYRPSNSTFYWMGCMEFNKTYVYTATAVDGTWTKRSTINNCYYDAGLLVDDNDTMYVAYGNSNISVAQLSADGLSQVRTQQVFTTPSSVGTLEGARFYKRNGSYYIFLTRPANGQYILKSSSPFGPYTMHPHQRRSDHDHRPLQPATALPGTFAQLRRRLRPAALPTRPADPAALRGGSTRPADEHAHAHSTGATDVLPHPPGPPPGRASTDQPTAPRRTT